MTPLYLYLFIGFVLLLLGFSIGVWVGWLRWGKGAVRLYPAEMVIDGRMEPDTGLIAHNESNWLDITELGSPKYRFMHRDSGKILEMDREG